MNQLESGLSFDIMLDALADIQRRKLLVALLEHNPQDDSPTVVGGPETEAAAMTNLIEMEHVHLPKLVEYGFIEWDRESQEVSKGRHFDEIRPLLGLLEEHGDELPQDWL